VVCNDAGMCVWTSDAQISPNVNDNCPGITVTYTITGATTSNGVDDAAGEIFELGISEVCYIIVDSTGNSDTCCFNVVVEDCENPMIVCPADTIVQCDGMGNATDLSDWLARVSATDNCDDDPEITMIVFNNISGCGDTEAIEYQFTATDSSGNLSICIARFTIIDTEEPTIDTEAMDITVNCDGSGSAAALAAWLNDNGGAEASDDCSTTLSWSNDYSDGLVTDQ
jgi:hypothetical protein